MSRIAPGLLVERAAALDADRLGDGDLDVVDELAVPDRLEDAVGEPQHQQVLHRLLAEVVVDAEDLLSSKRSAISALSVAGARRSCPNGFSMIRRVQPRRRALVDELPYERRDRARRHREVEEAVAARPRSASSSASTLASRSTSRRPRVEPDVAHPGGELVPDLLAERRRARDSRRPRASARGRSSSRLLASARRRRPRSARAGGA